MYKWCRSTTLSLSLPSLLAVIRLLWCNSEVCIHFWFKGRGIRCHEDVIRSHAISSIIHYYDLAFGGMCACECGPTATDAFAFIRERLRDEEYEAAPSRLAISLAASLPTPALRPRNERAELLRDMLDVAVLFIAIDIFCKYSRYSQLNWWIIYKSGESHTCCKNASNE